jgi:hypothetical protein
VKAVAVTVIVRVIASRVFCHQPMGRRVEEVGVIEVVGEEAGYDPVQSAVSG